MLSQTMLAFGNNNSVIRDIAEYAAVRRGQIGEENVFDFSIGNPNVPAPPSVTEALRQLLDTEAEKLHAYTAAPGDPQVRTAVADYICRTYGFTASAKDVFITAGASASLAILFAAISQPGDEVITFTPFFPEYRVYVEAVGAKLVEVPSKEATFQIDGAALEAAITARTKAVIVNSPNNPTGVVLHEESIRTLCRVLNQKAEQYGHPIYLVADEPYRELVYDDIRVPYIPSYYDNTLLCYSYSKTLSLPGERIGYLLISPKAEAARDIFAAVCGAARAMGYVCAPSLFQQLLVRCMGQLADISVYDRNRKLLYNALKEYGFEVVYPDGAFYLFMKTPEPDANAFCLKAREFELLMVPGDSFGYPGYVRIAYCVTTQQIRRSLPAFRQLAQQYRR